MEEAEERGVTIELVDTVGGLKMEGRRRSDCRDLQEDDNRK
jgi:hypothetical protein